MPDPEHSGFLNLNKPLGMTSHDVVAQVRRRYRALTRHKKVGHAGTLDPLASGVLLLCLGAATRLSDVVMRGRKVYRAQVTLGVATTTYDAAGDIVRAEPTAGLSSADLERQLQPFIGEIEQLPPMYSAVKVAGKKLYDYARRGQTVERKPRRVQVHAIKILAWDNPTLTLEVTCGAGVYVRSLAHDLGEALEVGAHLSALQRSASGNFQLADSLSLEWLLLDDSWLERIIPPYAALADQPRVILSPPEIHELSHGRAIARHVEPQAERVFAFAADQRLIAILRESGALWKPHKVFSAHS